MAQRAAGKQLSQNVCGTYQRGSFFVFNPSPTIYQLPLTCCPNCFTEIVRAPCNLKSPLNSKWYGPEIANSICMLHWPEIRSLYMLAVQTGNVDPVMLFLQQQMVEAVQEIEKAIGTQQRFAGAQAGQMREMGQMEQMRQMRQAYNIQIVANAEMAASMSMAIGNSRLLP